MAPAASPWTEDKVRELRQLWADGLSGTDIAKRLGTGFSRCSVLGKAFRLNLPLRSDSPNGLRMKGPAQPKPRKPRPMIFPVAKDPQAPKPLPPDPPRRPNMRKLPLVKLENWHCRWPLNSPPWGGRYLFCAADRADGRPYCAYHTGIAYHRPRKLGG